MECGRRLVNASVLAMALLASAGACKSRTFLEEGPRANTNQTSRLGVDEGVLTFDTFMPQPADVLLSSDGGAPQPGPEALALEKSLTRAKVCEDYELAIHMMALIQPPQGTAGSPLTREDYRQLLGSCPASYVATVKKLRTLQRRFKDFHTNLRAPGFPLNQIPTISECLTQDVCGEVKGSALVPLQTEQATRAYTMAFRSDGAPVLLQVLDADGRDTGVLYREMVAKSYFSKLAFAHAGALSFDLLMRSSFDEEPTYRELRVRDSATNRIGRIRIKYDEAPTLKLDFNPRQKTYELNASKHYACEEETQGSKATHGACMLRSEGQKRGLVWLGSFTASQYEVVNHFRKLVRSHPEVKEAPLILDLRGNAGGSPNLASRLACMLGGERVADLISRRALSASLWPQTITLSNEVVIETSRIATNSNTDLKRVLDGWRVEPTAALQERKEFRVGTFERHAAQGDAIDGPARCRSQHEPDFVGLKWVVLTSGQEFSATENFTSYLAPFNDTFHILGRTSAGGTGFPMRMVLPNTKIEIRLSQARQVDLKTGQWDIEGVGVSADQFSIAQSQQEFEAWANAKLAGTLDPKDVSRRPLILKRALGITRLPAGR